MKLRSIAMMAVLAVSPAVGAEKLAALAPTAPLTCRIVAKQYCDQSDCSRQPVKLWNVIDFQRQTYARCDRNGCDTFEAHIGRSGVYTNIDIEGRGLLAKIDEDGVFMEIVTLGVTAYVSHGTCVRRQHQ